MDHERRDHVTDKSNGYFTAWNSTKMHQVTERVITAMFVLCALVGAFLLGLFWGN